MGSRSIFSGVPPQFASGRQSIFYEPPAPIVETSIAPPPSTLAEKFGRAYRAIETAPSIAASYYSPGGEQVLSEGLTPEPPSIAGLVEQGGLTQDQIDNATYGEAIGRKFGGFAAEMGASPTNAALLLGTAGLGNVAARGATGAAALGAEGFLTPAAAEAAAAAVTRGKLAELAQRGISLGFAGQMIPGAAEKLGGAAERYGREGFTPGVAGELVGGLAETGLAGLAGAHAVSPRAIPAIERDLAARRALEPVPEVVPEVGSPQPDLGRSPLQRPAFLDEVDRSAPPIPPGPELGYGRGGVPVERPIAQDAPQRVVAPPDVVEAVQPDIRLPVAQPEAQAQPVVEAAAPAQPVVDRGPDRRAQALPPVLERRLAERREAIAAEKPNYPPEAVEELAQAQVDRERHRLTGLPERELFDKAVAENRYGAYASGDGRQFGILNKTHGHQAGDAMIKAMADVIHEAAAPHGVDVFHTGGDEFRLGGPDVATVRQAAGAAQEALRGATIEHVGPDGKTSVLPLPEVDFGYGERFPDADAELGAIKLARKRGTAEPGVVAAEPAEGRKSDIAPSGRPDLPAPVELAEPAAPAVPETPPVPRPAEPAPLAEQASVPAFVPRNVEQGLADLGYSKEMRAAMRPEEALRALESQRGPEPASISPAAEPKLSAPIGEEAKASVPVSKVMAQIREDQRGVASEARPVWQPISGKKPWVLETPDGDMLRGKPDQRWPVGQPHKFETAQAALEFQRRATEAPADVAKGKLATPSELIPGATAARERIRARAESLGKGAAFAGVDPAFIADHAIVGADFLAKGVRDFGQWSARMVSEFGEQIRTHLKEIWDRANEVFRTQGANALAEAPAVEAPPATQAAPTGPPRKIRPIPPNEPLGNPKPAGEPPRVETKVANLKEVAPDVSLARDAPRTWKSLDPQIREKLDTLTSNAEKEAAFYQKVASGRINDVEVQTLDALVRGKQEAYDGIRERLLKAKAAGRETGPENIAYLKAAFDQAAVDLAVAAKSDVQAGTRLARALAARARVMEAAGEFNPATALKRILREFPGASEKQAAALLRIMEEDPSKLSDAIYALTKPTFFDKFLEFRNAGLVQAPGTQFANVAGNTVEHGARLAETGLAALIDKAIAKPGQRERFLGEVGAELAASGRAVGPAMKNLVSELKDIATLQPERIETTRPLSRQVGAIGGKFGRGVRAPFRALDASDRALFQAVGGEAELGKLAYRKAKMELRNAPERVIRERAATIINELRSENSTQHGEILKAVEAAKESRTFHDDPWAWVRSLEQFKARHKSLGLFLPFVRTPGNIGRLTLQRSPLGFIDAAKAYHEYKTGKISSGEAADRIARPVLGTTILFAATAVAKGLIPNVTLTGSGPVDPREKSLLKDTNWQPYSFAVKGDDGKTTYVPFDRFEPISSILGFAADMHEAKDERNAQDVITKVIGSAGENVLSKRYLDGLGNFASFISDPKQEAGRLVRDFAGSLVPNAVNKLQQAIDPTVRETKPEATGIAGIPESAYNTIAARIPGLAQTLPERKSATGQTVERPGNAVSRFLSPVQISRTKDDSALNEMLVQIGYPPSTPKREVTIPIQGGKPSVKVRLSDEEYATLQAAQERASDYIRKNYIGNPQFERLPDTIEEGGSRSKEALVKRIYDRAHEDARKRLPALPSFRAKVTQARSARA